MTRPNWTAGDVIAMPQNVNRFGGSIYNGCAVFTAEHEPRYAYGKWLYGHRDCEELRLATVEDVERLLAIELAALARASSECQRLVEMLAAIRDRSNAHTCVEASP